MDKLKIVTDIVAPAIAGASGVLAAAVTANMPTVLGFGVAGVKAGSVAAGAQSLIYGAVVPAGSAFAMAQSWGATGAMAGTLGIAALPVGVVFAGGTWLACKAMTK